MKTQQRPRPRGLTSAGLETTPVRPRGLLVLEALSGSEILVADTVDGGPLSENQGPLRSVVPRDKRGARSVRMLQRLEVVRLPPPPNAPAPKPH